MAQPSSAGTSSASRLDPAVSVCYTVELFQADRRTSLGSFNSCEGLGCEVVIEEREEGGNNAFVWQLPTRMKYSRVKLTRAVGGDSAKLTTWLAEFAATAQRQVATITAFTGDGVKVAAWTLQEVIPVRWTGPTFNLDTAKVATETVELAHHGFLPGEG